jgi:glycine betaine transporter
LLDAICLTLKVKSKICCYTFHRIDYNHGVIASLGLGTAQVVNGINYAFKVDYGNNFLLLMVILIEL